MKYEEAIENIKDAIKLHVQDREAEQELLNIERQISFSTVAVAV